MGQQKYRLIVLTLWKTWFKMDLNCLENPKQVHLYTNLDLKTSSRTNFTAALENSRGNWINCWDREKINIKNKSDTNLS